MDKWTKEQLDKLVKEEVAYRLFQSQLTLENASGARAARARDYQIAEDAYEKAGEAYNDAVRTETELSHKHRELTEYLKTRV